MSPRMAELEDRSVQRLPFKGFQRLQPGRVPPAAIDRIADHRAAEMGEMDPHLMGPPGAELGPHQAGDRLERRPEALLQPVFGDGMAATGLADGHALAVDRM